MKSGEPMTGSCRRPASEAGSDMGGGFRGSEA
jgi:hypothetical protein